MDQDLYLSRKAGHFIASHNHLVPKFDSQDIMKAQEQLSRSSEILCVPASV